MKKIIRKNNKIDRKNRFVSFEVSKRLEKLEKPVVVDEILKDVDNFFYRDRDCVPHRVMDSNDRTLTIEMNPIVSTVVGKVRIFGANIAIDETYNVANNMDVTIPESSHRQVKNSTFGSPFKIKELIYEVSSIAQLANPIVVFNRTVTGAVMRKEFHPSNYTDPRNFNSLMIKTSMFQDVIDANKAIEIDFEKGANATMILTIADMIDLSNALY